MVTVAGAHGGVRGRIGADDVTGRHLGVRVSLLGGLETEVLQCGDRVGGGLTLTSGTWTSRVDPPNVLIAMVTTTVSTARIATAASHRADRPLRSRSW